LADALPSWSFRKIIVSIKQPSKAPNAGIVFGAFLMLEIEISLDQIIILELGGYFWGKAKHKLKL
jgi:ABC-type Na+ transport system ATPase subunit NatA